MTGISPWAVLGQSVPGTSHLTGAIPCQDACRFRTFGPDQGWLLVVVADGAGTAAHSDVGASLVCDEAVRRVEACHPDSLQSRDGMLGLFTALREGLLREADARQVLPRALACTALVALVGPSTAAFAQLGDGAIVFRCEADLQTAFWPEPKEYANATDFLTDEQYAGALQFATSTSPVTQLAVLTDGLQRLALDFTARLPHPGFFRPLFDRLNTEPDPTVLAEPLRAFLESDRVNARTDDDKTLVLATRRP